jgi:MoaA/NifB/PqqE/SkfB family radical SAM enzyme
LEQVIFLQETYLELLNREIDEEGLNHYLALMRQGNYSKKQIIRMLLNSEEYRLLSSKSQYPKIALENRKLNDQEIFRGATILKSKPVLFNLDLIGLCNMKPKCSMCLNWVGERGPGHHPGLTVKDIKKFEKFLIHANQSINCSIGEPLILKEFNKILALFYKWEKHLGINSNGIALSRDLTDQIAPFFNILTISFSLDAATAATYAKIRNHQFDLVIKNIKYYCQKRDQINPRGFASKTGTVFIPMQVNKDEIEDFIKLSADLGVDVVELRSLNHIDENHIITKDQFTFDYKQQMLSTDELEEIRLKAEAAAKKHQILLDCQYQVSEEATYEYFLPKKFKSTGIKCTQPWHFILPYQTGHTVGCCYMNKSLGNWREEKLEQLWNSRRMMRMRKEMAQGKLPEECYNYTSCPIVQNELQKNPPQNRNSRINQLLEEREFLIQGSCKLPIFRGIIRKIRQRMGLEVEHLITPILDNQKEINKILLKEIRKLKTIVKNLKSQTQKRDK